MSNWNDELENDHRPEGAWVVVVGMFMLGIMLGMVIGGWLCLP